MWPTPYVLKTTTTGFVSLKRHQSSSWPGYQIWNSSGASIKGSVSSTLSGDRASYPFTYMEGKSQCPQVWTLSPPKEPARMWNVPRALTSTQILSVTCPVLTFHALCWHFMTYAGTLCPMLALHDLCWHFVPYAGTSWPMLAFRALCWHFMTYVGTSWPMLAFCALCWYFTCIISPNQWACEKAKALRRTMR